MRPMPLSRQDRALLSQPSPSRRIAATDGPASASHEPCVPGLATYSWACCVSGNFDFVYVYGPRADCARLAELHHETTIRKGNTVTLALAQSSAEAAASALHPVYEGIGSVRAMPARAFLRQRYGLDLDRLEKSSSYA